MKELLISQIAPIITTAVVSVLVFIIKKVGDAVIELLVTKKKEVEQRIVSSGHEKELNTAKEVWNIVEEKFRITENCADVLGSKSDEFDRLLLSKIPGLTQADLDYLRQAVAGEVNKYKNIDSSQQVTFINTVEPQEIPTTENAVVDSNTKINSASLTDSSSSETNSNITTNSNSKTNSNIANSSNSEVNSNMTNRSNADANSNATANAESSSNTTASSNANSNNKDITASSNIKVDNPDNKQSLGATVNAISAAIPN